MMAAQRARVFLRAENTAKSWCADLDAIRLFGRLETQIAMFAHYETGRFRTKKNPRAAKHRILHGIARADYLHYCIDITCIPLDHSILY